MYSEAYKAILRHELKTALGCTEPAAIAYAAFKAKELLGKDAEHIYIECSGNVVKNAMGVTVPNSKGLRGIEAATILGSMVSEAKSELEVLDSVTDKEIDKTKSLMKSGYCECALNEHEKDVFIKVIATAGEDEGEVRIKGHHTNVVFIRRNSEILFDSNYETREESLEESKKLLNLRDIIAFAENVDYGDIKGILDEQIQYNTAIAEEGLKNEYGALIGRTILEKDDQDISSIAKGKTAAGSDARMGGCSLPVVINSGSGNQGITVTVPVVEYARQLSLSEDKLYRALIISNLTAVHIKRHIGTLSAFCGAVSAGAASAAAIAYLHDGDYNMIASTITNTLANVGGIICDGAKSSCAAKIASSIDAGIMAIEMSLKNRKFQSGEGIVTEDVEDTIRNIGRIGRNGMRETDLEILHIMV